MNASQLMYGRSERLFGSEGGERKEALLCDWAALLPTIYR